MKILFLLVSFTLSLHLEAAQTVLVAREKGGINQYARSTDSSLLEITQKTKLCYKGEGKTVCSILKKMEQNAIAEYSDGGHDSVFGYSCNHADDFIQLVYGTSNDFGGEVVGVAHEFEKCGKALRQ